MLIHKLLGAMLVAALVLTCLDTTESANACCAAGPSGKPVVNADQTVILIWDSATQTEHFIRQASFKSEADDFGFLVPTPAQPVLDESGNNAFGVLLGITSPKVVTSPRVTGGGCGMGCSESEQSPVAASVQVLEEKRVAGFDAVVLEASSSTSLIAWLKEHGYVYSPEIEAWAKPYVEQGWKFTALRVAKRADGTGDVNVAASALRISFKTDRPLFPYREPDSAAAAKTLGAKDRLLRIYFLSDAKYAGTLTPAAWTGQIAWADHISSPDRTTILHEVNLPPNTGPSAWWLTEFEDHWPYTVAPADLYFSVSSDQTAVKRPPIIRYVSSEENPIDVASCGLAAIVIIPRFVRRALRRDH